MTERALPAQWARLHPMSPVAKGSKAVAAVAVVTLPRELSSGGLAQTQVLVDLGVALAIVSAGIVSWVVTRWRVHAGELQLETGLLRRQSIRVPLSRIQAIDVVRPLVARFLGIAELRLVLAGTGSGKAQLAYLTDARALEVRRQLLALGTTPTADPPPIAPLAAVPNQRLVVSALLGVPALLVALVTVVAVVLAFLAPAALLPLLTASGALLFASITTIARRINVEFSFSIGESQDGLCLYSGMLQTRAETIPLGRVQGVRLVEPWLWRRFGWVRLEVDVAQQREHEVGEENVQQLTTALLPVGTRAEAEGLLARVLPGAVSSPPEGSRPPARARRKAPLSYRYLASWIDADHLAARTGRLTASTVIVPRAKVQSVRWTQGPLQRWLQLATVHVDTAGRHWNAIARDRAQRDGEALLWQLTTAGAADAPAVFTP
ncbi:MAG: rane-flanked domain [Frankiales bacterium]|nr:rane-flanked domain [Frankiales bacterium]